MVRTSRRAILRQAMFVSVSTLLCSGKALASQSESGDHNLTLTPLIQALRATGKSVCLSVADHLEALDSPYASFDLHLRSAGLTEEDTLGLAAALKSLVGQEGPSMRSFSVSFNPGMNDIGAAALLAALPTAVTEVGMVGCALGDASGQAVLDLVRRGNALRMICVEGNDFSSRMRAEISDTGRERAGLFIVV